MKKFVLFLFSTVLVAGMAMAQPPRPPAPPLAKRDVGNDLKTQGRHVKSSGNDLLHFRFKKAHQKHVAEAKRKNRGLANDLGIKKIKLPPPPPRPHN